MVGANPFYTAAGPHPGAELRTLDSIAGNFGIFGFEESFLAQVDANLSELLGLDL